MSSSGSVADTKETKNDVLIDPKDLDWDGPDDLDNPHNWPAWKKWYTTMTAAILCLVVTMGSSLFVTGVPDLVVRYGINQTLALSGLTFYLLGLSTVIGAPLSEVFGRKPVYLFSLPLSMLFTMGVGLSNGHMRMILPLRFLSGVFGSPALSIASGTIVDIFDIDEISVAMAFFCTAPFLGPVISPIIGGFATEKETWRWAVWIQLFAGGLIMPFIILMPETHKTVLLIKRAKKRNLNIKKPSKEELRAFLKMTMTITVFRPIKMLFVEPIVLVFSIYVAFIFAVLFGFFEAYPVIFRGVYRMSIGVSGLPFIGIGIGLWIGAIFYVWYDRRYFFPKAPASIPDSPHPDSMRTSPTRGHRDEDGNLKPLTPEVFLNITKIGSIALPIGLFWLGWTARESVHWMAPTAAGVPFGFGLILIFFSVIMYFSTSYPPLVVASAMAANNMLRYVVSCVFPLFTIQMYNNLGIDWASSLFGFICIAMIPIPWLFERFGPKMRSISQFGFSAEDMEAQAEEDNEAQHSAIINRVVSNEEVITHKVRYEQEGKLAKDNNINNNSTEDAAEALTRVTTYETTVSNESAERDNDQSNTHSNSLSIQPINENRDENSDKV